MRVQGRGNQVDRSMSSPRLTEAAGLGVEGRDCSSAGSGPSTAEVLGHDEPMI